MKLEEGRRTYFHAALSNQTGGLKEPDSDSDMYRRVTLFAEPVPYSAHSIAKLAPAVDPAENLMLVGQGDGDLRIRGIFHTEGSIERHNQSAAVGGYSLPDFISVAGLGTGRLEVRAGGIVLASLLQGEVFEPSRDVLLSGPVSDYFYGCVGLQRTTVHERSGPPVEVQKRLWCVRRLVHHVELLGHGGTIVFHQSVAEPDVLAPKYEVRERDLSNALAEWASEPNVNSNLIRPDVDHWLRFIARLSQVDGAVLLNGKFELLGFGCVIRDRNPPKIVHRMSGAIDPNPMKVTITNFGMRHSSVFALCSAAPEVLAFVVSQDGPAKAVLKVHDHVCYWDNISAAWKLNFSPAQEWETMSQRFGGESTAS